MEKLRLKNHNFKNIFKTKYFSPSYFGMERVTNDNILCLINSYVEVIMMLVNLILVLDF